MSWLFPAATNTNGGLNYNYNINRDKCIYLIHISYFFHYDISQKVNPNKTFLILVHIKKYLISVERYHRFIFKSALGVICLVCLWVLWIVPVQFIKNRGGGGGGKSPICR